MDLNDWNKKKLTSPKMSIYFHDQREKYESKFYYL
jgi:hypothetical protein